MNFPYDYPPVTKIYKKSKKVLWGTNMKEDDIKKKIEDLQAQIDTLKNELDATNKPEVFDFEEAEKTAVYSKLLDEKVATVDYYQILPNGFKKEYFTWNEAMALDLPDGWHIPSRHEMTLLAEEFGVIDDEYNTNEFVSNLGFNFNGCIDEGCMNDDGTYDEKNGLFYRGSYGYYWETRVYSGTYAYVLLFDSTNLDPQCYNLKGDGFSLRLIKGDKK